MDVPIVEFIPGPECDDVVGGADDLRKVFCFFGIVSIPSKGCDSRQCSYLVRIRLCAGLPDAELLGTGFPGRQILFLFLCQRVDGYAH